MKIAVYGKMRSGKTEVCNILKDILKDVAYFDFGDSLKECVRIMYPESIKKPKDRKLLIGVGQHMRKFDEDIWVNALKNKIENTLAQQIIVTGVRQKNEYEMLKKQGFIFLKVVSTDRERIKRCKKEGDNFDLSCIENETEKVLDTFEYSYKIDNIGDLAYLREEVKNFVACLILAMAGKGE